MTTDGSGGPERLRDVPIDPVVWEIEPSSFELAEHESRTCLLFGDAFAVVTANGIDLEDGVIEADLTVGRARSFHGLVWRAQDHENYESFFVRPHQMGNPDSIQYTPVNNGLSSWQLYHGEGYWAAVDFPFDEWFTIRIAFTGPSAEIFVADLSTPVLRIPELKREPASGSVGFLVGGPELRIARFAYSGESSLEPGQQPQEDLATGAIREWEISEPFPESPRDESNHLPAGLLDERTWTPLRVDRTGLADISRLHGIRDGRNTVLARATIASDEEKTVAMDLGFSDRAKVYLNGIAVFSGDETYRSRDYRFLGSIGYWHRLYLPVSAGHNELVIAVSEDFGGWGIQARFPEPDAIQLNRGS